MTPINHLTKAPAMFETADIVVHEHVGALTLDVVLLSELQKQFRRTETRD